LYAFCSQAALLSPYLVIIDGLDKCQGNNDQSIILSDVLDPVDKHRLPLRFLIMSRPESHIQETFAEPVMSSLTKVLSIYGSFGAHFDVVKYLRDEFRRIHNSKRHKDIIQFVSTSWPSDKVIQQIAKKSGGYFIYAATIIKYIDEEYFSCLERLDRVLGASDAHRDAEDRPFAELDRLYSNILSACLRSQLPVLKRMFVFLKALPKASAIEAWSAVRAYISKLRGLRSIVAMDYDGQLSSLHASFLDFLFNPDRAKDYHVDVEQCYTSTFRHNIFVGDPFNTGAGV
jgi:hypothetical protein